jgi:hypothetical protein
VRSGGVEDSRSPQRVGREERKWLSHSRKVLQEARKKGEISPVKATTQQEWIGEEKGRKPADRGGERRVLASGAREGCGVPRYMNSSAGGRVKMRMKKITKK